MSTATQARADVDLVAVPVRHPWRWVAAAIVVALMGLLVYAFAHAKIDWSVPGQYLLSSEIVSGAGNTLLISILAQIIGVVLGVLAAIMRQSDNPVAATICF